MAHPSFPWQDEALAVATHKPNVYIDLSGWSPKYFPPQLVQYANTLLKDKVLFGSDYPVITPDRWLADFDKLDIKPEVRPEDPQGQRRPPARARTEKDDLCMITVDGLAELKDLAGPGPGPQRLAGDHPGPGRHVRRRHRRPPVDPRRRRSARRQGPFGGTIAHGYLTLSLVIPLSPSSSTIRA